MPDYTVSTDVDTVLKSADNAAVKQSLGLGTAADNATGDFATAAQGQTADTALQPADPTLDSITGNGATTANNITIGGTLVTGNNTAVGSNAVAVGGSANSAQGHSSEVLGGDNSTASGQGATVVGGNNVTNRSNWSAVVGGLNHDVLINAHRGAIIAGYDHHLNHTDSVVLGGNNITTDATNTVFVPNLNIKDGFKMPTGAADDYILTSDASGVGSWEKKTKVQTVSTTAGVLSFDYSAGEIVKTTLTENVTSLAITNANEGDSGMIILTTDGLGAWTFAEGSNRVLNGLPNDVSTLTGSDKITIGYYYDGTEMYLYISLVG